MAGRLALTTGDPGGIGPDLCLCLAGRSEAEHVAIVGDPALLRDRAKLLGHQVTLVEMGSCEDWCTLPPHGIRVWPTGKAPHLQPGKLSKDNAPYVLATLDAAVEGCLSGYFDAMVTAPISKAVINESGLAFSGHTEYLAEKTGGQPVMLLASSRMRVALATTHLPLSEVPSAIRPESLESVLRTLHGDLITRFGIPNPYILVAGLNPHAGESGHLGMEEMMIIQPVVEALRLEGFSLEGPLPADTLFLPKYLERADAVLAMYHDQGLPVLKHQAFGCAVNITLGLPILRTSVDHGTAVDLAGTGQADPGSLLEAIRQALDLVRITAAQSRSMQS